MPNKPASASAAWSGPLRYALYVRKSTEEDERQTQSLQSQCDQGQELAKRTDCTIVLTLQESRSAKETGREQFNRMLTLIDAGEIDGIIAWHPDRLSRNEMDAAEITMRVRKGILKDLAFVSYFFHNSPEGVMMLQMALCQSQYMVSKLSTDVRRGLGDKIKKGWFPHRAPLGYLNDKHKDKGDKTISADPERFPLLRLAWDMLLTGAYSVPELQRILNEDWGVRTAVTRSGRGGRPLAQSTLYRLFGSIFYAGLFVHDGTLYTGAHPPMVTLNEFDRAQRLLGKHNHRSIDRRGNNYRGEYLDQGIIGQEIIGQKINGEGEITIRVAGLANPLERRSHTLPFTGLIRCASCGGQVTGDVRTKPSGRSYTYYHCQGKNGCIRHFVPQSSLEEMLDAELSQMDLRPEFYEWAIADIERASSKEQAERQAVYDQKLRAEREADGMLDALLGMRLRGLITDAEYQGKRTQLTLDRERLRQEVGECESGADRARAACVNAADYMKNARLWLREGDPAMKRIVAFNLGSNYVLKAGKLLLEPHPMLVRVKEEYRELAAEYGAIKQGEIGSGSRKEEALEVIRTIWSGIWEVNYTEAIEHNLSFPKIPSPKISFPTVTGLGETC